MLQEAGRVARLQVLGQDQHPDLGVGVADLLRRDQALVGVGGRHLDVDDRHVGMFPCHKLEKFLRITGLAGDLDTGVFEEAGRALPDQHGVIGDHDPHGISARMMAPPPVPCPTWNWPPSAPTRSATPVSLASSSRSGWPAPFWVTSTTSRLPRRLTSTVMPPAAASVAR